ncbi:MAG TPA: winged helix-turn-helix domain-containing protein [Gemmatimonadaceae bacterium]|nr:winged helix-turn-helix domain-containing protein [Gemmatimonadaceae bacterium]
MAAGRREDIANVLRQRIFSGLHLGTLRLEDRLPSARDLAEELDVDRRVVLAAYRVLEKEGLVELRERSGIYLRRTPQLAAGGGGGMPGAASLYVDVALRAIGQGIPVPELTDSLHASLRTLRLRAACMECNDDQIDALCVELRTDYGLDTVGVNTEELASRPAAEQLARADLLVTTTFHAGEVREVAAELGKSWVAAAPRTDVFAEIMRLLPAGPLYFVVTDPRFAEKLRKIYAQSSHAGNLRVVVLADDDPGAAAHVPPGAPVYITGRARERLAASGSSPLLERVTPEVRVFSRESAREILEFIVRANTAVTKGK